MKNGNAFANIVAEFQLLEQLDPSMRFFKKSNVADVTHSGLLGSNLEFRLKKGLTRSALTPC